MNTPTKQDGWGAIADYIIRMEQDGAWQHDAATVSSLGRKPSYNKWGNHKAAEIGISTFVFWQYRRAGLLYNELRKIPALDLKSSLDSVPPEIKAESLNELDKLHRVMPDQQFIDLCKEVLSGQLRSRKKLRELWDSLRPAMHGATARKRNIEPDDLRISGEAAQKNIDLLKGRVLLQLKDQLKQHSANRHSWQHPRAKLYDLRENHYYLGEIVLDAVVVKPATNKKTERPTLHGILITDSDLDASSLERHGSACHYLHVIQLSKRHQKQRPASQAFVGWQYVDPETLDISPDNAFLPTAPNRSCSYQAIADITLVLLL